MSEAPGDSGAPSDEQAEDGASGSTTVVNRVGWEKRTESLARSALRWGWLTVAICVSPAWFLWPITHREKIAYVQENDLSLSDQTGLITWMFASGLLTAAIYFWRLRVAVRAGEDLDTAARRMNGAWTWLLGAALFPILLVDGIEVEHPFFTSAVVLAIVAALAKSALELEPRLPATTRNSLNRHGKWIARGMMVVAMGFYAWRLSTWAILDHHTFSMHVYDLGIYENIVWQSSHGNLLGCSFIKSGTHVSAHVDPILVLLAPIYLLAPRAETLLVFQSVWLSLGAVPLLLLGERKFGRPWLGLALGGAYLLQPALHGMNMYMFHSLTLAAPLVLWVIWALECERRPGYWVFLVLLLLTREDMALLACFVGTYAVVTGRVRQGLITIAASLLYFAFVKAFVMVDSSIFMADSKQAYGYSRYYAELIPHESTGARGLAMSVVSNPQFVTKLVTVEAKVLFLIQTVLPVLALPLLAGRRRVVLIYGGLFLLLASHEPVFTVGFQYAAVFFPFLLALTPFGIERLADSAAKRSVASKRSIWFAAALAVVLSSTLFSYCYGVFWPNGAFKGGYSTLDRDPPEHVLARHARLRELVDEHIDAEASVSATKRPGAHVAGRREAYLFPKTEGADYLLILRSDLKGRGARHTKKLDRLVDSGEYRRVDDGHGLELYRRRGVEP